MCFENIVVNNYNLDNVDVESWKTISSKWDISWKNHFWAHLKSNFLLTCLSRALCIIQLIICWLSHPDLINNIVYDFIGCRSLNKSIQYLIRLLYKPKVHLHLKNNYHLDTQTHTLLELFKWRSFIFFKPLDKFDTGQHFGRKINSKTTGNFPKRTYILK